MITFKVKTCKITKKRGRNRKAKRVGQTKLSI